VNRHSGAFWCFISWSMNVAKEVFPEKLVAQTPGPAPSGGGKLNVAGWQSSRILMVGVLSAINNTAAITGVEQIISRLSAKYI